MPRLLSSKKTIIIFAVILVAGLSAIRFAKLLPDTAETKLAQIKYQLADAAAIAFYNIKQLPAKVSLPGINILKSKRGAAPDTNQNIFVVSESGQDELTEEKEESSQVKGAVLGEGDNKPIYFQYLPVPSISNFSTSPQTAGATISYPIETPPGPGGMTPSVGLSYSSAQVDNLTQFIGTSKKHYFVRQAGPVGLGWGISGGGYSITIDTHGEIENKMGGNPDKSKWTFHLNGPMGSAELIKVDANGNKISRNNKSKWENGRWATDPELFIRILEGPRGENRYDWFYTDSSWRIKTSDGTEYIFQGVAKSYAKLWYFDDNPACWGGRDYRGEERVIGWNLKTIRNNLGQEINYSYERFKGRVGTGGPTDGCYGEAYYVGRTAVKEITYGPHKIEFTYGEDTNNDGVGDRPNREDWRLIKETDNEAYDGDYVFANNSGLAHHENTNAYASTTDKALSEVRVKTNGNLVKKYKLNYYNDFAERANPDQWINDEDVKGINISDNNESSVLGTAWCGHCPKDANDNYIDCCPGEGMDSDCTNFNGEGCYKIVEDEDDPVDQCNQACEEAGYASGWCNKSTCAHPLGSEGDYGCSTDADPQCCCSGSEPNESRGFKYYGVYNLNDGVKSYHLHLKSIQEFGKDGSTSLPAQNFTYHRIPYRVWWDDAGTTVDESALNSIYIKTAENGYGGKVEYTFENLQQPVTLRYSDGASKIDSKNPNIERSGKKVRFSLQRAKLKRTTTHNGMGEWWQNDYIYSGNATQGGLGYMRENPRRYEYLGFSEVATVTGVKNKNLAWGFGYHPDNILSASKSFFHQGVSSSGCFRKDPRAGLVYKSWVLDGSGNVFSETLKEYKFTQARRGEECINYRYGQIPLLMETKSASVNTQDVVPHSELENEDLYDYCNFNNLSCARTKQETVYDWDFTQTPVWNRDHGNFAAAVKKINYGDADRNGDEATQCMQYTRQIDTDNWLIRVPKAQWVQDGSNNNCATAWHEGPTKYEFTQFYYDSRNSVPGSLPVSNPKGLVTKTEVIETDSGEKIAGFKEYDRYGNVTKQTDPKGNSSYTRYYSGGIFPKETKNALGHQTIKEYDFTLGVPTRVTDANGAVTEYAYDALGRLLKVVQPGDSLKYPTSRFEYFVNNSSKNAPLAVHKTVKVNDEGDTLESYDFYNGIGQKFQTQSKEPDGKALTNTNKTNSLGNTTVSYLPFKHNSFGRAVDSSGSSGSSQTFYDLRGRAYKSITPDGRETRKLFREADFLTASVDSENRVAVEKQEGRVSKTITCRNKNGEICSESSGLVTTSYQDILGNTIKVVDSDGTTVTENAFDTLGRKQWTKDADLGRYDYKYDKNGNLVWQKDPLGNETTFGYDALDRTVWKKFNGSTDISYSYDKCANGTGRKCAVEDNYQKTGYSYDERGRLESVSKSYAGKELAQLFGSQPYETGFDYDNIGREAAITYPDTPAFAAETVNLEYDGVYLKRAVGQDTYISKLTYNTFGQIEQRVLGNSVVESFNYNNLNKRLTHIGVTGAPGAILDLEYDAYSPAGNILSINDNLYDPNNVFSMDQDFTYDNFYRLTGASGAYSALFNYDDLDRMTYKKEGPAENIFSFNQEFPYHGIKDVNGTTVNYDQTGKITDYSNNEKKYNIEWDYSVGKPSKIIVEELLPTPPSPEERIYWYDSAEDHINSIDLSWKIPHPEPTRAAPTAESPLTWGEDAVMVVDYKEEATMQGGIVSCTGEGCDIGIDYTGPGLGKWLNTKDFAVRFRNAYCTDPGGCKATYQYTADGRIYSYDIYIAESAGRKIYYWYKNAQDHIDSDLNWLIPHPEETGKAPDKNNPLIPGEDVVMVVDYVNTAEIGTEISNCQGAGCGLQVDYVGDGLGKLLSRKDFAVRFKNAQCSDPGGCIASYKYTADGQEFEYRIHLITAGESGKGEIFYCSFNNTPECESPSSGEPIIKENVTYGPAKRDQGVLIGDNTALSYYQHGNLPKNKGEISFWLKTGWSSENSQSFALLNYIGPDEEVSINYAGGFEARLLSGNPEEKVVLEAGSVHSPGDLIHLALQYNFTENNYKLYINGKLRDSSDSDSELPPLSGSGERIDIGTGTAVNTAQSIIDELKITEQISTEKEICESAGNEWDSRAEQCGEACTPIGKIFESIVEGIGSRQAGQRSRPAIDISLRNFMKPINRAYDSRNKAHVRNLIGALDRYMVNNPHYPIATTPVSIDNEVTAGNIFEEEVCKTEDRVCVKASNFGQGEEDVYKKFQYLSTPDGENYALWIDLIDEENNFLVYLSSCAELMTTWLTPDSSNLTDCEEFKSIPDRDKDGYDSADFGGTDCNDQNPNIHPDAQEVCDGKDNNCNGLIDENILCNQDAYKDVDFDNICIFNKPVLDNPVFDQLSTECEYSKGKVSVKTYFNNIKLQEKTIEESKRWDNINLGILATQTLKESNPIYTFTPEQYVSGISIDGNVLFHSEDSSIRIILKTASGKDYIVYQETAPESANANFKISNTCGETCVLNFVEAEQLSLEIKNAEFKLTNIAVANRPLAETCDYSLITEHKLADSEKLEEREEEEGPDGECSSDPACVEFIYDGNGTRIVKKITDENYTLYPTAILEKVVTPEKTIWRKHYNINGQTTAVRIAEE